MTKAKAHDVEAWLGDGHSLTAAQMRTLTDLWDTLTARGASADERQAVMSAALRLTGETATVVVADFGAQLEEKRVEQRAVLAALEYLAKTVVDPEARQGSSGVSTQRGFTELAGVDRMTVRKWLGLR